jgi:hypothetical protein
MTQKQCYLHPDNAHLPHAFGSTPETFYIRYGLIASRVTSIHRQLRYGSVLLYKLRTYAKLFQQGIQPQTVRLYGKTG